MADYNKVEDCRELVKTGIKNGKIHFEEEHDSDGKFIGCYFGNRRFDWYCYQVKEIIEDSESLEDLVDDIMEKLFYVSKEEFIEFMDELKPKGEIL